MKVEDCWRLAKISLQARAKATRNTICGMVISLVIIIPFIYAIFGLNVSVKGQLNSRPELLNVNFTSSQSGFETDKSIDDKNVVAYGNNYVAKTNRSLNKDRLSGLSEVESDTLHYVKMVENIDFLNIKLKESISFNGRNATLRLLDKVEHEKSELAVLSSNSFGRFNILKSSLLKDGFDKGFTQNGAKQVILSERYLAMANLKPKDVYGKKISINITEYAQDILLKANGKDDYMDKVTYKLFEDFEVVGIMDNSAWKNPNLSSGYETIYDGSHNHYAFFENANIIVSGASYYGEDGKPAIRHDFYVQDNNLVCDLGDLTAKTNMAKDYLFCGANSYNSYLIYAEKSDVEFSGKLEFVEEHIFRYIPEKDCTKAYDEIEEIIQKVYPIYKDDYSTLQSFRLSVSASELYYKYSIIGFFMNIIITVLSVFSIIILLAALINLFNTIMHSVQSRKGYLAIMRAVGAKSKDIPKLYFFEIIRLMSRACIWIVSLSTIFSIVVKIVIDKIFSGVISGFVKGAAISLPWYLIPVTILIFVGLLAVVGLIYAIGCSYKMAYKPIVETLQEN